MQLIPFTTTNFVDSNVDNLLYVGANKSTIIVGKSFQTGTNIGGYSWTEVLRVNNFPYSLTNNKWFAPMMMVIPPLTDGSGLPVFAQCTIDMIDSKSFKVLFQIRNGSVTLSAGSYVYLTAIAFYNS